MLACQNSQCSKKVEFMYDCKIDSFFCSSHIMDHVKLGKHDAKNISDVENGIKSQIFGCLQIIKETEKEMITKANKYILVILQKLKEIQSVVSSEKKILVEKLGKIDLRNSFRVELETIKMDVLRLTDGFEKLFSFKKQGTLYLGNGDVYEGDILDNKGHGQGICKLKNGNIYDVYEGGLIDNKKQGKGVFRLKNGDVYEGEWIDNKKQGNGVYFLKIENFMRDIG